MMKTKNLEAVEGAPPDYCTCLMPLGSKTCHHCKKQVKPPATVKPLAVEGAPEQIWIDRYDIAEVSEPHQVDPDGVEYVRADLARSEQSTRATVRVAAEKLYKAGCGHVMEVSEIEAIIFDALVEQKESE